MSTQQPETAEKSYKQTLNLPVTDFPMKADLVRREPERLAKWKQINLYTQVLEAHASDPAWVLHDGPPFANSDIHIGHLLNKTLKDVVIRYRTMKGHKCPYVPGWDCHGLPIEHQIQQQVGSRLRDMDKLAVRKLCWDHAEKYIARQSEQFQRLGILGDWDRLYKTMAPEYEAQTLDVFARFVEHGLVYKKLKPVHWSIANRTALADAELEYRDREDPSVWVEFPVENPGEFKSRFDLREEGRPSLLIWTTTPWTLPANLAIAVHPDVEYDVVAWETPDGQRRLSVVASKLRERTFALRKGDHRVLKTVHGQALAGLAYVHPFVEARRGGVVTADYVTTEDGTGLVHTAPGHGEEDYQTGLTHGLEVYCPVDPAGRFDSTAPNWITGLTVWDANPVIAAKLKELGMLFHEQPLVHSYPHDWRSKTPTIFRATEQWFISLDTPYEAAGRTATLRERAIQAANDTIFYPAWGRARLLGMLENRPDWCISRQRAWGLPIPVFYNEKGDALLTPDSVRAVGAAFARHGSDAWFRLSPAELLEGFDPGPGFPKASLRKENDIFDVWFESGSSWHGVLDLRRDLPDAPADLYLEGSDQHRGWFQLSMLAALGSTGRPPFREILTHGFIVKPDGTKVSKSDKEYVTATQEVERHGADLLRLWSCSVDYQNDVRASPEVIQKFGDDYRKIRNTLRFLLGNLSDYEPQRAAAADIPAQSLDGWMMYELDSLVRQVRAEYDAFLTHRAFRLLFDFCNTQISAVYGNAMKDRLYCELPDSPLRRRSQAVQWNVASALIRLLAPMTVFTADEAWEFLPGTELPSVHLARLPEPRGKPEHPSYAILMRMRDEALLALDRLKREQGLNKATDAEIVYRLTAADRAALEPYGVDLADVVGAGSHSIIDAGGDSSSLEVVDRREAWRLCARSRKRTPDVGSDPNYPDLTARDAAALRALAK